MTRISPDKEHSFFLLRGTVVGSLYPNPTPVCSPHSLSNLSALCLCVSVASFFAVTVCAYCSLGISHRDTEAQRNKMARISPDKEHSFFLLRGTVVGSLYPNPTPVCSPHSLSNLSALCLCVSVASFFAVTVCAYCSLGISHRDTEAQRNKMARISPDKEHSFFLLRGTVVGSLYQNPTPVCSPHSLSNLSALCLCVPVSLFFAVTVCAYCSLGISHRDTEAQRNKMTRISPDKEHSFFLLRGTVVGSLYPNPTPVCSPHSLSNLSALCLCVSVASFFAVTVCAYCSLGISHRDTEAQRNKMARISPDKEHSFFLLRGTVVGSLYQNPTPVCSPHSLSNLSALCLCVPVSLFFAVTVCAYCSLGISHRDTEAQRNKMARISPDKEHSFFLLRGTVVGSLYQNPTPVCSPHSLSNLSALCLCVPVSLFFAVTVCAYCSLGISHRDTEAQRKKMTRISPDKEHSFFLLRGTVVGSLYPNPTPVCSPHSLSNLSALCLCVSVASFFAVTVCAYCSLGISHRDTEAQRKKMTRISPDKEHSFFLLRGTVVGSLYPN